MLNSFNSLLINSIDSSIFFGSKKQDTTPIYLFVSCSMFNSANSALISSNGISVSTPAPSPLGWRSRYAR